MASRSPDLVVEARGLRRRFGADEALRGLDLIVERGDIYGFLGRNGAGKSTTIRILAGLIRADGGEARLLGASVDSRSSALRRKVGFLVENPAFYPALDAVENLTCHAYLQGAVDRAHIEECLDLVGLADAARRPVKGYSFGMRQRLGLAQAFLGDPEVIILDEPAIGLDPPGVIAVREIIRRFVRERGATFLISSHILGEMERLCTRVGIIESGRMLREGTLFELGATGRVVMRLSDPERGMSLAADRFPRSAPRQSADHRVQLVLDDSEVPGLVRLLVEAGIDLYEVSSRPATLEELFLELVDKGGPS